MDHAEEATGQLVVAGSDGAVDLEMTEHALDAIALTVETFAVADRVEFTTFQSIRRSLKSRRRKRSDPFSDIASAFHEQLNDRSQCPVF